MTPTRFRTAATIAAAVAGLVSSAALAEPSTSSETLPAAVRAAFTSHFPNGSITGTDVEEENDVTVYELSFTQEGTGQETAISADGTVMEVSVPVGANAVPTSVVKAAEAAAPGAKVGQIERVDVRFRTKDGGVVRLPAPATEYEVAVTKDDQSGEVSVGADGTIMKSAVWSDAGAAASAPDADSEDLEDGDDE